MKVSSISTLTFIFLFIFSCSSAAFADGQQDFLRCFSKEFSNYSSISKLVYTPSNSSYTSVLQLLVQNLRFWTPSTPKPQVIITPEKESQIPPIIYCAKESNIEIRTRSGGHDFEGLSYVAQVPFIIIDLIKLSDITIDAQEKTAWVGGGANLGSLYYKAAQVSPTLGFPAGLCPTVGVGGHISGGGYGTMLRKYGLAWNNRQITSVDATKFPRARPGERRLHRNELDPIHTLFRQFPESAISTYCSLQLCSFFTSTSAAAAAAEMYC